MRASLYLVGFAAASLLGAGIFEIGCSSSSSPAAAGGNDAATDSGDDAGDDGGGPPCTKAPVNAATFDSGSSVWGCFQTNCTAALTACGTDCPCNDAVLTALQCESDGGSAMACFTPIASVDTAGGAVITCLVNKMTNPCGLPPLDGGGLDGAADSGTVADTGTTTDGATDGGTKTDGATDGGAEQ